MTEPSREETGRAVAHWTILVALGAAVGAAVPKPFGLEAWPLAAIGAVGGHVIGGVLFLERLFPGGEGEEVSSR